MKYFSYSLIAIILSINTNLSAYSTESNAKITDLHNNVQKKNLSNLKWKSSSLEEKLFYGDSIRTGKASRVEVKYTDGTVSRIGSNSILKIKENKKGERISLKLLVGKLWLKVTKGQGLFTIETPTAIASVLGTELLVTNNNNNVSHVTTLDGLVEVKGSKGDKVLVKPGNWVEIFPNKKMEEPTPFNWNELKANERFLLDPSFKPSPNDFKEESNWK